MSFSSRESVSLSLSLSISHFAGCKLQNFVSSSSFFILFSLQLLCIYFFFFWQTAILWQKRLQKKPKQTNLHAHTHTHEAQGRRESTWFTPELNNWNEKTKNLHNWLNSFLDMIKTICVAIESHKKRNAELLKNVYGFFGVIDENKIEYYLHCTRNIMKIQPLNGAISEKLYNPHCLPTSSFPDICCCFSIEVSVKNSTINFANKKNLSCLFFFSFCCTYWIPLCCYKKKIECEVFPIWQFNTTISLSLSIYSFCMSFLIWLYVNRDAHI